MVRVRAEVIGGHMEPLIRRSGIGGIRIEEILCSATYPSSMKEQVEPESRKEKREIKLFTNKRKKKGVWGVYCIELYSSLSTGSTRMAILHLCCIRWIAYYFFFS